MALLLSGGKNMKKFLITLMVLFSFIVFAGNFSLSVLNLMTIGLNDGSFDNFPILYATYKPFDFLKFKVNDYLALSHDVWNIGDFSIAKPRYYYLEGKFNIFGVDLTIDALKARLKSTQTEKLDGLRVGGLKFDYYGLGLFARYGVFNLGGAYNLDNNTFAAFSKIDLFGYDFGVYYENRYNQLSADMNKEFNFGNISLDMWGALSAKTDNLMEFSYLVGARAKYNNFELSTQFLKIGANVYDVDFQTGDPIDKLLNSNDWAIYADLDYHLNDYVLGIFVRYNSVWVESNMLPLYGAKLSYKDFTLKVGNGDLLSGDSFGGKQLIAVELNYFYSLDFENLLNFSFGKKENISAEKVEKQIGEKTSYSSLMDVAFGQEGAIYTVKGIVTSPKDLLGKGSFYIQDEVSGLMIYAPSFTESLETGDVVVVTGKSKLWNGIVELVADSIEVVGKDKPKADVLTSLSDVFLSSLVYVEGVVKEKRKYDFVVDTGEFLIKVYLKKGTNIDISNLSVGSKVKVTGILTLYKGEYEILPRGQFDVEILK